MSNLVSDVQSKVLCTDCLITGAVGAALLQGLSGRVPGISVRFNTAMDFVSGAVALSAVSWVSKMAAARIESNL